MPISRRSTVMGLALAGLGREAAAQGRVPGAGITVERFGEAGSGPLVLLLHGADGPTQRGQQYRFAANALASQGLRVLFPHYLEATGDTRAAYREIASKFPAWLAAISATAAAADGGGRRIGVVGVSLGGALAFSLASREPRVGAIVSYFGFLPEGLQPGRAPALLLHGEADRVVPVSNAGRIAQALRRAGADAETVIYPGEGHGFNTSAQLDAARRTAEFLTSRLA